MSPDTAFWTMINNHREHFFSSAIFADSYHYSSDPICSVTGNAWRKEKKWTREEMYLATGDCAISKNVPLTIVQDQKLKLEPTLLSILISCVLICKNVLILWAFGLSCRKTNVILSHKFCQFMLFSGILGRALIHQKCENKTLLVTLSKLHLSKSPDHLMSISHPWDCRLLTETALIH